MRTSSSSLSRLLNFLCQDTVLKERNNYAILQGLLTNKVDVSRLISG
jgi:hypothetical protein